MEKIKLKRQKLLEALDRLGESLEDLEKVRQLTDQQLKELASQFDFLEKERMYRSRRDSLIQRFEFCSDLFWKYLKIYMTDQLKRNVEVNAPESVIRDAHNAKIISEQDTRNLIEMIDDRNMSTNIYKEEIADQIGLKIALYYDIMRKYANNLKPHE